MGVCFLAGDCLVQEIKAPNSVTELEGMSGVLSSPDALPNAGPAGVYCSGLCPLKLCLQELRLQMDCILQATCSMFDCVHNRNISSYVLGYRIIDWWYLSFYFIPFVSCCSEEPAFVYFTLLHPLITCQMLKALNQLWPLAVLAPVCACLSMEEPRTRQRTLSVSHCAEQKKRLPSQTFWQVCLVQLRRLLTTFARGLQCWFVFRLSTRTLMLLFEKLLSS